MNLFEKYKESTIGMLQILYPMYSLQELEEAIEYSWNLRFTNSPAYIENNYKNKTVDISLAEVAEVILAQEPIITSYGVMFKKACDEPNPIDNMIQKFIKIRKQYKKEMFKHPKGSELFNKYNLLQLLAKIDANGMYGVIGNHASNFYNINVAASITTQGRASISSAGLAFEGFMANNAKFLSLDDVITFINNVLSERGQRKYKDHEWVANVSPAKCFYKIMSTCGYGYIPQEDDLEIVWTLINRLDQEDLNRLFYKNNLFEFVDNEQVMEYIKTMIRKLREPFLDPNEAPKEIEDDIEEFWEMLKEYVYYGYMYIDKMNRLEYLPRKVALTIDTDSNIVNMDPWYIFIAERVKDVSTVIRRMEMPLEIVNPDEFGDRPLCEAAIIHEYEHDYDFYTDKLIQLERQMDPLTIIPEDGMRYTIINILAYCLGKMVNDYMIRFTKNCNSLVDYKPCALVMKNEFLFDRSLLASAKKNYASLVKLQEGNIIPPDKALDIKGLPMNKSTMNKKTQNAMKKILVEDILKAAKIDQLHILKQMIKLEKQIYHSLRSGKREFYKPSTIKPMSSYDDPFRVPGVKAAYIWNEVTSPETTKIDLNTRTSLDIVKVIINKKNVDRIKDIAPDVYERMLRLMENPKFAAGFNSIGVPLDFNIPEWIYEFIDYKTIINDAIGTFPLESIGLQMVEGDVCYSNILSM